MKAFGTSKRSLTKRLTRSGGRRATNSTACQEAGTSRKTKIGRGACRRKEENEKNSRGARQFLSRRPYRMLIKRVSTVSKYLTAGPAWWTTGRSVEKGHGIVFGEQRSLMYASGLARWSRGTVWVVHVLLPRHSPMLRALLCALYTLSLLHVVFLSFLRPIRHSDHVFRIPPNFLL